MKSKKKKFSRLKVPYRLLFNYTARIGGSLEVVRKIKKTPTPASSPTQKQQKTGTVKTHPHQKTQKSPKLKGPQHKIIIWG